MSLSLLANINSLNLADILVPNSVLHNQTHYFYFSLLHLSFFPVLFVCQQFQGRNGLSCPSLGNSISKF